MKTLYGVSSYGGLKSQTISINSSRESGSEEEKENRKKNVENVRKNILKEAIIKFTPTTYTSVSARAMHGWSYEC